MLMRDRVRAQRKMGASLNELTARFEIPKSTVQYWCRDILLSSSQLKRIAEKQRTGGMFSAEMLRKRRISITQQLFQEGISEIGPLSPREFFLVGASLYWAEGYRKGGGEFGFTNSDPKMIKFMIKWLETVCEIPKERICLRVCINAAYEKRYKPIQKFWVKAAKIPLDQFTKPTFIYVKNKKIYATPSKYYGTLRVKISKGTNFRRKLLGWIEGIAQAA